MTGISKILKKTRTVHLKKTPPCIAILLSGLTFGCSLGIGSEEYGCSGLPKGVRCQSAREVYLNRKIYGEWSDSAVTAARNDYKDNDDNGEKTADGTRDGKDITVINGSSENEGMKNVSKTVTGSVRDDSSNPVFIRTRDDIMITVISPHEDEYGNLHDRAVIYSSLNNGSWGIVGNPHGKNPVNGSVAGIHRGGAMPYREVPSGKTHK